RRPPREAAHALGRIAKILNGSQRHFTAIVWCSLVGMRLARLTLVIAAVIGALGLAATPVIAQTAPAPVAPPSKKDLRIPIAVLDVRGVFARLGQDPTTATGLSTAVLDLP